MIPGSFSSASNQISRQDMQLVSLLGGSFKVPVQNKCQVNILLFMVRNLVDVKMDKKNINRIHRIHFWTLNLNLTGKIKAWQDLAGQRTKEQTNDSWLQIGPKFDPTELWVKCSDDESEWGTLLKGNPVTHPALADFTTCHRWFYTSRLFITVTLVTTQAEPLGGIVSSNATTYV